MKVVAIGGGTGLSNILTGLKEEYGKTIKKLTAIVTVADSGGSSGILKKIYDIPAVGDIRNCLIALSNIENYLKKAFQYRFKKNLGPHPLGNLFLVALSETEGNILKAVKKASKVLNVVGEVIPSTFEKIELVAKFEDGKIVEGEEEITNYGALSKKKIVEIKIKPEKVKVPKILLERIKKADLILFGPGSLFTSILPNLLIEQIQKAVNHSKALKIFIVNLLTQPGETDDFTASDHIKAFLKFSKLNKIDVALVNKQTKIKSSLKKRMLEEKKKFVKADVDEIEKMKIKVYSANLIKEDNYLKHHPQKLKNLILKVAKDFDII